MKVSLNWLNSYVDTPKDLQEFCDRLDLTGTGVEGVETIGDSFDHVVTAQVISKEKHPDSDHMWVCMVDVGDRNVGENGENEPLQIVCGAQNFEAGDKIVCAMVGAVLPGDFKIKKSKLRGVASCGMNCSARELGLGNDHDGIMILPEDAPVGIDFAEYLNKSDIVLDLEITPNRPDCLSIAGMAREVGAIYGEDWRDPLPDDSAKLELSDSAYIEDVASATVEDGKRSPRYTLRVIKNVKIGPSPEWMVERLAAIGQRSINNIVDITNYILFLYGQPLHSFDLDKVKGDAQRADIVVRAAKEGEKLVTLDGVCRELNPDMTVISTPERGAIGLAGVMGGQSTEVDDNTVNILLEAATFEPGRTSRTSRNLGLISESSLRYERGVDDHGIEERSAAACALIQELAGGEVLASRENGEGIIDIWPIVSEPKRLQFRIGRFCDFVGAEIPREFIVDELTCLGCAVLAAGKDGVLEVVAPTFRPDLEREIDLYEEVLRLWGMDKIPSTLPSSPHRVGTVTEYDKVRAKINTTLRASGMNETMTYSFAEPSDVGKLRLPIGEDTLAVQLMNPINADQSVMRQSIIPGLIKSVAYNQSHGVENVQLYEIGTVFSTAEGRKKPKEKHKVAGVLAGSLKDAGWNEKPCALDFFDGKGILENLARELAFPKVKFKALADEDAPHLQPGRAAEMLSGSNVIGWVGEIHPSVVRSFGAQGPIVAFELDFYTIQRITQESRPYVEVPRFPAIEIDQNFVVNEDVTNEKLLQFITSAGGKQLESASLFDVYRDEERVGANKKSMAYKLTYRAQDRTLTSEEVERAHEKLIKKVSGSLGAETRG